MAAAPKASPVDAAAAGAVDAPNAPAPKAGTVDAAAAPKVDAAA